MRTWQLRVLLSVQQKPLLLRLPLVPAFKAWEEVEGGLHATAMQPARQGVLPSLAWGGNDAGKRHAHTEVHPLGWWWGQQQQPRSQCHYGWWRWW